MDLEQVELLIDSMRFRGAKGTTGTQASFLSLFGGDHEKVKKLDRMIAEASDFSATFDVTGQTYPRKLDSQVLNVLSGVAQSAYKFAGDIRVLQSLHELEEPLAEVQISDGSLILPAEGHQIVTLKLKFGAK